MGEVDLETIHRCMQNAGHPSTAPPIDDDV